MMAKMRLLSALSIVQALVIGGCVGGSKETTEQDKERMKAYILDTAPANIQTKLDINYDGKVTLVGYSIDPRGTVPSGGRVKLTMYWRCDKKLDDGWNLFTHVLDGSGERVLNIDNVGPIREWRDTHQVLWPTAWDPGKIYVDEQVFTIPPNLKTDRVQVVTGVWRENDRLKIVSGPHDRENRGIVVNIPTGAAAHPNEPAANTRVPTLRVDKLDKSVKINIDGKLDEDAWKTAPVAGPFVDVRTGRPNTTMPINGSVKLLWNDEGMYLGFDVKDPDVTGGFKKDEKDPHLWTKDAVEIMVDPDGDGDNKDYYEIQINPQDLVFDSQFDDYNKPKTDPDGPFGHQEWSAKLKSAVTIDGTIDKSDDRDKGYVVEAMLPWKSFSKAKKVPPAIGDAWRMNFYAMENNNGVAWSAILGQGNFHKASRFGKVIWAEKGWTQPGNLAMPVPSGSVAPFGSAMSIPSGAPSGLHAIHPLDANRMPRVKMPPASAKPQH